MAEKILVIEDEALVRDLVVLNLKHAGYQVTSAATFATGAAALAQPDVQLAIVDVMLPGGEGFQLVRDARDAGVRYPILMLTARSEVQAKVRGLDCGADDYLTKPFDVAELLARIRSLLRRATGTVAAAPRALELGTAGYSVRFDTGRAVTAEGEVTLSDKELQADGALLAQRGQGARARRHPGRGVGHGRVPHRSHHRQLHPAAAPALRGQPREPGALRHRARSRLPVPPMNASRHMPHSPRGERVGVRGVVLVNVGTPDAPIGARRAQATWREFLNDPRVIDLPTPLRWLLLNLIILPFRPSRSAHAYQQIWTPEGSPLLVNAKAQARRAARRAARRRGGAGDELRQAVDAGRADGAAQSRGVTHITLVPMFPQYASATTGGTVEAWHRLLGQQIAAARRPPCCPRSTRCPGFIEAFAERLRETVARREAGPRALQLPRPADSPARAGLRRRAAGRPCGPLGPGHEHCYRAQCFATAEALTRGRRAHQHLHRLPVAAQGRHLAQPLHRRSGGGSWRRRA